MRRYVAPLCALLLVGTLAGCGKEATYDAADVHRALTKAGFSTHIVFDESNAPASSFRAEPDSLEAVIWKGMFSGAHVRGLVAGPERPAGINVPDRYAVMAWILPSWQEARDWVRERGGISRENVVIDAAKPLRSRLEAALADLKNDA